MNGEGSGDKDDFRLGLPGLLSADYVSGYIAGLQMGTVPAYLLSMCCFMGFLTFLF